MVRVGRSSDLWIVPFPFAFPAWISQWIHLWNQVPTHRCAPVPDSHRIPLKLPHTLLHQLTSECMLNFSIEKR